MQTTNKPHVIKQLKNTNAVLCLWVLLCLTMKQIFVYLLPRLIGTV